MICPICGSQHTTIGYWGDAWRICCWTCLSRSFTTRPEGRTDPRQVPDGWDHWERHEQREEQEHELDADDAA